MVSLLFSLLNILFLSFGGFGFGKFLFEFDGGGGAEDGAEEGGSDLLGLVGLIDFFLLGGLGPTDDDGGADGDMVDGAGVVFGLLGGADLGTGGFLDGAAGLDGVDFDG